MSSERFQRVRELFHACCGMDSATTAEWLQRACGDDDELRREVEELLAEDRGGTFDAEGGRRALARELLKDVSRAGAAPASIGRYEVVRKIGEGGMGVVYEARQAHPRRSVALKVIRPGFASANVVRRFQQEAELLARLQHPGLAQVFEAAVLDADEPGRGTTPRPYIAMELIEGLPLDAYAVRANLGVREKLALMAKVCDAVQHAHQHGVIHRDLKPANILVGAEGQPKVIDFGVARATDLDVNLTTRHTNAGEIIGTIAYMSPEQVRGDAGAVDTRSDVYALGVMLYELLAGGLPYDVRSGPIPEAVRVICEVRPARLSAVNRLLRGDIETIVNKALEKERHRRYQSAGELADDIRRYLRHEPIVARPPTAMYQLRKFAQRHKGLVTGTVLGAVTLVAGSLIAVSQAVVATRARDVARVQRAASDANAYRASIAAADAAISDHDVSLARQRLERAPAALRNWEWRYLQARLDDSLGSASLRGLRLRDDCAVRFTDADQIIEVALADGTRARWNARTLAKLPDERPGRIEFTAYAARCASIRYWSGLLEVRETGSGAVWSIRCEEAGLTPDFEASGIPLSPDGHRIAYISGSEQTCYCIDLESGAVSRRAITTPAGVPLRWVLGANGYLAFASAASGRPALWNAAQDAMSVLPQAEADGVWADLSPDSRYVACAMSDGSVRLWSAHSGALIAAARGHVGRARMVRFSPDGKRLVSIGQDRTLRLWDGRGLAPVAVCQGHDGPADCVAYSADGTRLASVQNGIDLRVWDATVERERGILVGHKSYVYAVAVSPDGARIASAGWDGYAGEPGAIRLWDAATGAPLAAWGEPDEIGLSVAFSPDGRRLAAATQSGWWVRDIASGRVLMSWPGDQPDSAATDPAPAAPAGFVGEATIAFDPGGEPRVLYAGSCGPPTVYASDTGAVVAVLGAPAAGGTAHADAIWSSDGIITSASAGDAAVWDATSFKLLRSIAPLAAGAQVVRLARHRDRVASATGECAARVSNVNTGRLIAELKAPDEVLCVAFSPDGTRIATGGRDQVIRLWDATTYDEVLQLRGHESYVKSLVFSGDGELLVSGSGDGTVRVWDARSASGRRGR